MCIRDSDGVDRDIRAGQLHDCFVEGGVEGFALLADLTQSVLLESAPQLLGDDRERSALDEITVRLGPGQIVESGQQRADDPVSYPHLSSVPPVR